METRQEQETCPGYELGLTRLAGPEGVEGL